MSHDDRLEALSLAEAELATAVAIYVRILGEIEGERVAHNLVADYAGAVARKRGSITIGIPRAN